MKTSLLIVGLATWLSQLLSGSCSELIVKVNEGLIKGRYMASKQGRLYAGFMGIPYAEPPLGPLRFKAPVSKKPWEGVKDTTKPHAVCPQRNIFIRTSLIEGQEDCLFLSVYTPKLDYKKNAGLLPVMLYIHGGGFLAGGAVLYTSETMMDRDVVLVVINYRLGALGFLTTGDEVCPGNNGLKDQSLAIKWTKDNIRTFGGDPERITLFGESAGGASVTFHLLSPLSQNLFQAGISESGTAVCPWAFAPKGEGVTHGKKLARIFNCPTGNSTGMLECLRRVQPMDMIAQDTKFVKWDIDPMIPFKPCIEPKHKGAFLTAHPLDIIKSGKVPRKPWMTGINTEEGAIKSSPLFNNPYLLGDLNDEFNRIAPISLLYDKLSKNADNISRKIREFYFDNGPITTDRKSAITNLYTDGWLMSGVDEMTRYFLKYVKAPIYYYLFGYRGTSSMSTIYGDPNNNYGVCHADELLYLFPMADELFPDEMQQPNDVKMAEVLTTVWVNFAKTGKPTPRLDQLTPVEWKPVQTEDIEYYFIGGPTQFNMTKGLYLNRTRFWRDIQENDLDRSLRGML